jgi:hypothetical protein
MEKNSLRKRAAPNFNMRRETEEQQTKKCDFRSGANLINIQGLGLGFKKRLYLGLRLTVIFEFYKHELEA